MRVAGLLLVLASAAACSPPPPNIVFVLADDLGWGDLGAYGSERLRTPRLDELAAAGTRFTEVYAGSAVCAPSRCTLMTGRHSGHCTVRDNLAQGDGDRETRLVPLGPDDVTVASLLRHAGYATGLVGKWGLGGQGTSGAPDAQGFDSHYGLLDQRDAWDHFPTHVVRDGRRVAVPGNHGKERTVYALDLFTEEAIGFVRRHRDEPFFLYLAPTLPHAPFDPPSLDPYEGTDWAEVYQAYGAMVTGLDAAVGRLLDELARLELDRRTVVFVSSDNGPNPDVLEFFASTGGLRGGKASLYEGGIRVPMLVRWPGHVPAGRVSDRPWTHADFLPTALALAGSAVPDGLAIDGRSVLPTLLGDEQEAPPPLYWELYQPFQQAARLGRWKAVRFGTQERLELYDLATDPGERRNVASRHRDVVRRLGAVLAASPSDSPYWTPRARRWRGARASGS